MHPSDIKNQKVTVIGAARSGLAVARLLVDAGAQVFLTERDEVKAGLETALQKQNIVYEFGGHTEQGLVADWMVISPGVPASIPLVQEALKQDIPVYSEVEVATWFCKAPIVAVTGSNGKTTTTSWLGHVFEKAGRPHVVAGNIGIPFSSIVQEVGSDHVVILEVSNFQLDHIDTFRPQVSLLLNITPDHLDRYPSFEAYAESKFRVFENQVGSDTVVFGYDDPLVRDRVLAQAPIQGFEAIGFSQKEAVGAFVQDGDIILHLRKELPRYQSEETLMQVEQLALRGRHNLYNSLATAVAARVMEIHSDVIRESLMTFEGVSHRLEWVREVDGVRYVNDSKATNVESVWYALESCESPVVLIAGGRDKNNNYHKLKPLIGQKARGVVAIGESGDKVMRELGSLATYAYRAYLMAEAVEEAHRIAQHGDIVLLSPACSSFDMFTNFEERGQVFKRLVHQL